MVSVPAEPEDPSVRRAWGWVEHLRGGGTTPWPQWTGESAESAESSAPDGVLPGAQQLELLRRLNREARDLGCNPGRLAERVLAAPAAGRGLGDLGLDGVARRGRFGPPPVDPTVLPEDELVRVAVALLAEDLVAADVPRTRPRDSWPRPWRRPFSLAGDPVLVRGLREDLVGRGRPPGGWSGPAVVLGADVGTMLVHAWQARAVGMGAPPWSRWVAGLARTDRLPAGVDLLALAQRLARRVGRDRVHVVLDPRATGGLVGVRRLGAPPAAIPAEGVELARRVGPVVGLLVARQERPVVLREALAPRLAGVRGEELTVPTEHRAWLETRAARMRDGLLRGGYPVHGDPDSLLLPERTGVEEPSPARVLGLAVRLLLRGVGEVEVT